MKLQLGFNSIPYSGQTTARQRRSGKGFYGQGKNTQQVANELEIRYNLVETFYNMEEDNIIDILEDAFAEDIDEILTMGKPSRKGISDRETKKIEAIFREKLDRHEYDGVISGVPTKASQREGRPSFVKTGLYRKAFTVWVEDLEE